MFESDNDEEFHHDSQDEIPDDIPRATNINSNQIFAIFQATGESGFKQGDD